MSGFQITALLKSGPFKTVLSPEAVRMAQSIAQRVRNIAAENYFYKLEMISPEEADDLRPGIVGPSSGDLKQRSEDLLKLFMDPHSVMNWLQRVAARQSSDGSPRLGCLSDAVNSHCQLRTRLRGHGECRAVPLHLGICVHLASRILSTRSCLR